MADNMVGLGYMDPTCQVLSAVGRAESNIRGDLGRAESNILLNGKDSEANIRYGIKDSEANVRSDVQKASCENMDATKTSGWQVADRVGTEADRVVAQDTAYYIAAAAQRADLQRDVGLIQAKMDAEFERMVAVTQLQAAETRAFTTVDGEKTRNLINEIQRADANRMLLERNQELVACRDNEHRHRWDMLNAQFNALSSQINAFQSNLSHSSQRLVNLGTLVGGQTNTPTQIQ